MSCANFASVATTSTRPSYVRAPIYVDIFRSIPIYILQQCTHAVKVDREKQLVCIDEQIEDITIDDLQEQLPGHQPRYIIYSYKMIHDDQRVSYPMCFIFYTPRDSQIELQMMYAGTKRALAREADLTKTYEIRELDELTEDWLKENLTRI